MNPKSRLNSQHAIKYIATTHILLQKTYCYTVAVFYRQSIFVWLFFRFPFSCCGFISGYAEAKLMISKVSGSMAI